MGQGVGSQIMFVMEPSPLAIVRDGNEAKVMVCDRSDASWSVTEASRSRAQANIAFRGRRNPFRQCFVTEAEAHNNL